MFVSDAINGSRVQVLTQLIELTADAIIVVDIDFKIVVYNNSVVKMFGYNSFELLDRPLNVLIPEKFRTRHDKHLRNFNEIHKTSFREISDERKGRFMRSDLNIIPMGMRKNGEMFEIEATISKVIDNDQVYFAAIIRDTSKHHKILDETKQRETELTEYRQAKKRELLSQVVNLKTLKLNCT